MKSGHNLNVMVGTQYELTEYDYFGAKVKDIQNSLETINGAGTLSLTDQKGTKWHEAIMSYYSRLNYNYKSKYLAEVTSVTMVLPSLRKVAGHRSMVCLPDGVSLKRISWMVQTVGWMN